MTDLNKEREAFEKDYLEIRKLHGLTQENLNDIWFEDRYIVARVNDSWQMWQKAKAQAVPEGCVLLPRVATETMANAFDIGMLESEHFFGELDAFKDAYTAMVKAAGDQNENS